MLQTLCPNDNEKNSLMRYKSLKHKVIPSSYVKVHFMNISHDSKDINKTITNQTKLKSYFNLFKIYKNAEYKINKMTQ